MAKSILSEKSEVVFSCHQGLSAKEIMWDCLEKAKALAHVGSLYQYDHSDDCLPAEYLSLLDDVLELCIQYGLLANSSSPLIMVK